MEETGKRANERTNGKMQVKKREEGKNVPIKKPKKKDRGRKRKK